MKRQTVHVEVQVLRTGCSEAFEAKLRQQMTDMFRGRSLLLCKQYQETASFKVGIGEAVSNGRVLADGFVTVGRETDLEFHFYRTTSLPLPMGWFPSSEAQADAAEGPKYKIQVYPKDSDQLWESLVFEGQRQYDVLYELMVMHSLSDQDADPNIINCNRLILLTGPPGTGKTTLCHALAQKMAIRTGSRVFLAEINCQAMLSKWFSESGKLIQGLFDELTQAVSGQGTFDVLLVLFDEIESLLINRANLVGSSEPSDSLRVLFPPQSQ